MTSKHLLGTVSALLLAEALMLAAPAFAQLDEIIVTARKREESLQTVPVAVSAFTAEAIEKYDYGDLVQLSQLAPQLIFLPGASGNGAAFFVRGIGTGSLDPGLEASVTVNVDGMQIDRGHIVRNGFLDLESVQVLKGPQALFFGKNSPAGVIALTGARPGDEFEARAQLGYEFDARQVKGEVMISGPINDKLGIRLAYRGSTSDGYLENVAQPLPAVSPATNLNLGTNEPFAFPGAADDRAGGVDEHVARLTIDYQPNEDWDVVFRILGNTLDTENYATIENVSCSGPSPLTNAHIGEPVIDPFGDCSLNGVISHGNMPPELGAAYAGANGGEPFGNYDSFLSTLSMDWDVGDLTITSTTGHYWFDYNRYDNFDGTVYNQLQGLQIENQHKTVQELSAITDLDGSFDFYFGGLFERFVRHSDNRGKIFPLGFDPITGQVNNWEGRSRVKGEHWSVFGQVIAHISDEIEATAGLRFTNDRRQAQQQLAFVHSGTLTLPVEVPAGSGTFVLLPVPLGLVSFAPQGQVFDSSFEDDNVSPEVTLSWTPNDDLTIYGAYKTGYKAGGFSTNTVLPSTFNGVDAVFRAETADGFEVGIKSTWFDGRARANLTFYRYNFEDLQVSAFDSATTSFQIRNAASARTSGVEFEGDFSVTDELLLTGQFGYNKAPYTDFRNAPCFNGQTVAQGCIGGIQDLTGNQLGFAPKWTGQFGLSYDRPIPNSNFAISFSGDAYYQGETDRAGTNPFGIQEAYWQGNLRLGVHTLEDNWDLSVITRNVSDELVSGGCADKPGGVDGRDLFCQTLQGRQVLIQGTWRM